MEEDYKVGDVATRWLAGTIRMDLKVTSVTDKLIICGEAGWQFDKKTGAEVDEDLGWGSPPKITGSFILVGNQLANARKAN